MTEPSSSTPRAWLRRTWPALVVVGLALVHSALIHAMADHQVAARLFSAATTAGAGELALAIGFLLARLNLYLLGPGLLVYALVRLAWRTSAQR